MSTTDKTESLYDSVTSPADAGEQADVAVPAADSGHSSEHPVETSPAESAAATTSPVAPAAPTAGPSAVVPSTDSKGPESAVEDTAALGSKPAPAAQAMTDGGPDQREPAPQTAPKADVAPRPIPNATPTQVPPVIPKADVPAPIPSTPPAPQPVVAPHPVLAPERAAVPTGGTTTVVWNKDVDARNQTHPGAAGAANHSGTARRAAQSLSSGDGAEEAAQARAQQEAQARAQQEEAELRAREKAERDRRLGTVHADEQAEPVVPATVPKPTTDKFMGSVGLFVLRLVTAALVGVFGFQVLTQRQPVIDTITRIGIPQASLAAWALAGLLLLVAAMILAGFGTRVAGFILAALGVASLVFVKWGAFNPFREGQPGFSGDVDLLLAGVGWTLLFIGAGGWSLDAGVRRSRARKKLEGQD